MKPHPHVKHPQEILNQTNETKKKESRLFYINDLVLEWITSHVLASVVLFDIALLVPLLTLTAPESIKITLGVVSSGWIQWWALPALQRSQEKTQAQNDAKAEVDHETLTYLLTLQDQQMDELKRVTATLEKINKDKD